jgi:pimeloyl-ACP methyl ester carboxylesterase
MDIKHHFIEKGQGEPLILLHGNGENCDYFTGQVDAFAKYYHVYALDAKGIRRSVQCPIEMGYWFAKLFENKSDEAKLHAEMLGLMVHDPNVKPEELMKIQARTLVIAGTKDMVKDEHTRQIASHIPDAQLVILDGDHFVANKCPDAFNRAVLNFLRNE